MMPALTRKLDQKGFTLVEVIVTIIVTAILGVIFINFMGTAMSKSVRSVEMVRDEAIAEAALERIIADFVFEINKADPSQALKNVKDKTDAYTTEFKIPIRMEYVEFVINGTTANEKQPPPSSSNTLKVTVEASGNNLTTLLALSRTGQSPPTPPVSF
jgi:prepilin-type N-terminal cleavage/methylation domain-containing protein